MSLVAELKLSLNDLWAHDAVDQACLKFPVPGRIARVEAAWAICGLREKLVCVWFLWCGA